MRVVVITARQHAARALREFRGGVPDTIATFTTYPIRAPQLENVGKLFRPAEWTNVGCEAIKRLYMTGVK